MKKCHKLALSLFGIVCAITLSAPAIAQEQEIVVTANLQIPDRFEPVKMVVSIKDIDLSTAAGAGRMETRIGAVIRRFCEPPARAARWQVKDSKVCSNTAWASARPQMDEALRKARGS